ncbi:hypothetical protein [Acidocella aminolytica]|uniref:Uncharacterized protein n=1 Tax=Acidocella aminolytica 101 = DSM 11237 TaxID=1120923 RepID=A0A0D6PDH1_9PROT|nr:hypothetical protein [Acidocella aminolytica]GAN79805.1 hypothetical protein Aam_030_038 [Acidocella aminolytica 101 = DSM 11237]GBQ34312.1 hypothetical protein AA11237_0711 [Acidocella aminolytica 101 = DSM 11237]SHF36553.1 hypothetical protein SAMN02746095_02993 [Acidocella aminolytica 101 = DSM 11237]
MSHLDEAHAQINILRRERDDLMHRAILAEHAAWCAAEELSHIAKSGAQSPSVAREAIALMLSRGFGRMENGRASGRLKEILGRARISPESL